jgi:radical SAM protein with 4Fe4S-binding SPASM domain
MCCGVHSPYRDNWVPLTFLKLERVIETLEYLHNSGTKIVLFSWVGEPFAHKDVYEILQYCSDKFLVYFQTNASLINEDEILKMNFTKLLSLSVNFNAVSEKSYKLIYWNQEYSNLKKVIKKIIKLKNGWVEVKLIFIVSVFNYKDVIPTLILAEKMGVNVHLEFSNEFKWKDGLIALPESKKKYVLDEFRGYLLKNPQIEEFVNTKEFLLQWSWLRTWVKNFKKCSIGYMYMRIEEDGSVYPCNSTPKEYNMGNLNENSLSEIWDRKYYSGFREDVFSGKLHSKCCDKSENTSGSNYKIRRFIDEESSYDYPLKERERAYWALGIDAL